MSATVREKPWDFSAVLGLVHSLQPIALEDRHIGTHDNEQYDVGIERQRAIASSQGLGDLSRVFQFLGTPTHSPGLTPAAQAPLTYEGERKEVVSKDGYVSDRVLDFKRRIPEAEVAHFEDCSSTEEQAVDAASDSSIMPDTPTLTKNQRKKRNRKERRAKEAALAAAKSVGKAAASESEADIAPMKVLSGKPIADVEYTTPRTPYNLRDRNASGKAVNGVKRDTLSDTVSIAVQRVEVAKKAQSDASLNQQDVTATGSHTPRVQNHTGPRERSAPVRLLLPSASVSTYHPTRPQPVKPHPLSAYSNGTAQFFPSTVQPLSYSAAKPNTAHQQITPSQNMGSPNRKPIKPMVARSGEDRHWALLTKLVHDFKEDRKHLIAPMNLTTHNNDPKGIHVFVDASNIFIGFNEQLKRSRGIPPWTQLPLVDLSFDALALLIERRRPVAKRVLAGSMPHLPAFDKAKAVGYECNILEKVYKARELTERQIYFKEHDRNGFRNRAKAPPANKVATVNGDGGSGSGSETTAPQYAAPAMIEQGVDEILHLKILESVVDTDVPSTIVLATGDAAQAEYSQGFMAMADRALKKGWTVELVSWSKNISAMYTRRNWVQAWGERFKIVTLDDYAEELLDM